MGQCVKCARTITAAPVVARQALHPVERKRGRRPKIRACRMCGAKYSAREMRIHKRECGVKKSA